MIFRKIDFSTRFYPLPLFPAPWHVVRLNRTRGSHRSGDVLPWWLRVEGCTTWFERARGGWSRPGIWSGGVDDAIAYVGWHKGNRSTNQGISREPTLPTNKFSPRRRTFVEPPSTSPSLSPCVTLWESRDLVFRGWKSGPRRLISIVGRTMGHRLPF